MTMQRTVFQEMRRTNGYMARAGSHGREIIRHMDAVARDIIERGGTRDIEEFVFALHGLEHTQESGYKTVQMYRAVDSSYGKSATGKLFIPSGISMQTHAHVESPLYYVPERKNQRAGQVFNAASSLLFRVEKNDRVSPSMFLGRVTVPGLLVIRESVRDITAEADVAEAVYEPKCFKRFVGQDGQPPLTQFGIPPIPRPLWEMDIVSTLTRKDEGVIDMGDVANIATGLGNARLAFWQYGQGSRPQVEAAAASTQG